MAAQKLKVLIVELSSCVALTPRRETYGDESAMNQRMTHSLRGLFTEVPRRGILGTRKFVAPTLETLEGEHPVGLCSKPRYVGGCRPSAIDDCRAVLRRPTGELAALSDIHGDLVVP
jgi:hypothetical protein